MAEINLSKYGITGTTEIVYNPSYETLFEEETKPELEGYEKGQESELGAVNVMTGIYTGRSPKDKFIVEDENSKDTVWWTTDEYKNDNHKASKEAWAAVKDLAIKELSNKKLYVVDAFCGANKDTRMAIRFIVEVAWQAHFVTNMFIKPTEEELKDFEPDFVVYNASKAKVENYKELGLNSETAVVFNITSREQVIVNTWYGGEMKKGMFSMMNYFLPLKGIASMHCSANTDLNGENTAIFFGLSGTGKTTLSTSDGDAEARGANRFWAGALVSSFMQDLRAAGRHAQKTRCRCTAGWGHASIPAHGCEGILRASPRRSPRGAAALPVPEPPDDAVPALLRPALRHGHSSQAPMPTACFCAGTSSWPGGQEGLPGRTGSGKKAFPSVDAPPCAMLITNPY